MANWASTSYRIKGSESELRKIFNVIEDFITGKNEPVEKNASREWEGNIVKALGATKEQMEKYYLRGFIYEYEFKNNILSIEAQEAWGATDFRHILRQLMPELNIYFVVDEPDCEVYATNDADGKYFSERFYVDACVDGNYESDYFETEEQAMFYAAKLLGKEKVTKEELENWKKEEEFIRIHEFEVIN